MRPLRLVYLKEQIIYGPVSSRRLGRSLGINVLGSGRKVCTFDCVYCQLRQPRAYEVDYAADEACRRRCDRCRFVQPTLPVDGGPHLLPSVRAVLAAVATAVRAATPLDSLTLSGNGEPTIHPEFAELVEGLGTLRDAQCPGTAITVLSNSSTLWRPSIRRALARVDVRVMKLDVGDATAFRLTNRPCPGVEVADVVDGLRALGDVVVQTMFVAGPCGNAGPEQIDAWLAALSSVRPRRLQIYSLDRVPAEATTQAVPRERLEEIARLAVARTGAEVRVY